MLYGQFGVYNFENAHMGGLAAVHVSDNIRFYRPHSPNRLAINESFPAYRPTTRGGTGVPKASMSRIDTSPAGGLSTRQLSANAVWSLTGQAAPFVFALPAVPLLIHLIGPERFGVLSIIWVAIGYFNLFDLGLGRAVTRFAAERIGAGQPQDVSEILWNGLVVILPLSLIVAVSIVLLAPVVSDYVEADTLGEGEIVASLRWLAVGIPFVMATTMFKGLLQAAQAFRTISIIQFPLGGVVFLGPVLVAWLGFPSLKYLTVALLVGRAGICIWYVMAAARLFPNLLTPKFSRQRLGSMLRYSGWIALSNFIGPAMVYFDRLAIAAYFGATAVAYYATPFDVITRTSILSVSIAAVVFPAVAYLGQAANRQISTMLKRVQALIAAFTFPVYFMVAAFAGDLLTLWINPQFADPGALPAAFFCAGMFANSIARIPHAVLQGRGRADQTALAHLIELPIYFGALFLLLPTYGLAGAAACWGGRAFLDYTILQILAGRLIHRKIIETIVGVSIAAVAFVIISSSGAYPLPAKIAGGIVACGILIFVASRHGFSPFKLLNARRSKSN